jgi:DNA-binding NtrC family response regulator
MPNICRVLIVEDNEDVQNLLEDVFVAEGYRFAIATDAIEMRRIIAADHIDVVIIDVLLPGGESGLALAHEVAAQGYGVVLVTGHPSHFEAVEKSGHRYLHKPFRLPSLLQLVDEVLKATKAKCETRKGAIREPA